MIYNYEKAFLDFNSPSGIEYQLQLRPKITVVVGDSATGKTYLANALTDLKCIQEDFGNGEAINVDVFNGKFPEDRERLVIVDKGERQFSEELHNWILSTKKLHYLIFARGNLNLGLTPNYYGEFKREGNLITMYYRFNERLWFK